MVEHLHLAAAGRLPLTEAALCAWVGQAGPGEQLVYHCGFLAIDTAQESRTLTPEARQQLRQVADRAYQLFQQGLVHLVQHREAPGEYRYLVVSRSRPPPHKVAAGALTQILEQAGYSDLRRSA